MKGQIRKRGNTFSVIVPLGKDASGKKRYKWVTCPTKREAEAKRAELVHQANSGILASPKGTVGEFIERWLNDYGKQHLSPTTLQGYQSIYRSGIAPILSKIQLKALRPEHIQKYYTGKLASGISSTTVNHHAMVLHKILETAVKWQVLPRNVADSVSPPRIKQVEMHILTEEQAESVLAQAERTPYFALFSLALFTGMRQSELLALRWQDIDLIGAELSVSRAMHRMETGEFIFRGTKTSSSNRSLALSPKTCAILRRHLDSEMDLCVRLGVPFTNDRLVFCRWDGTPLKPGTVRQSWKRLTSRLGIVNINFHALRHSHATLLLREGISPKVISERLGHANITTTLNIYAHVTPGMQRQAVEAFDRILEKRIAKE
ncbi:tyrosine-type recombinase/integrase [Chloroflexota bacterium]